MGLLFQKKDNSEKKQKKGMNTMLRLVCAGYLLYTVYSILVEFKTSTPDEGTLWMIIAACVVFTAVAIFVIVSTIRHYIKQFKETLDVMDEMDREEQKKSEITDGEQ